MTDKHHAPGLLDEPPMLVYPSLAEVLGINKAVLFQQLHFLLNGQRTAKNKYNFVHDCWWVYNSYPEWKRDYFTWLSESAIKKLFTELEKTEGVVKSLQGVKNKSDRRKWYTIDYEAWDKYWLMMRQKMSDQPSDKNCLMVGQNLSDQPSDKNKPVTGQKLSGDSSETSSKIPNTSSENPDKDTNPSQPSDEEWLKSHVSPELYAKLQGGF